MLKKILMKSKCYIKRGALCLTIFTQIAVAAPSFVQPQTTQNFVTFESNTAECQQQEHGNVCTYSGNANFEQSDSHLSATEITVYKNQNNIITKVVANGKGGLAHYNSTADNTFNSGNSHAKTKNKTSDKPVNAKANVIKLYPNKNLMVLIGRATMTKEQDKFTGPYIEYNTKQKTIYSKPDVKKHTSITLYPKHND